MEFDMPQSFFKHNTYNVFDIADIIFCQLTVTYIFLYVCLEMMWHYHWKKIRTFHKSYPHINKKVSYIYFITITTCIWLVSALHKIVTKTIQKQLRAQYGNVFQKSCGTTSTVNDPLNKKERRKLEKSMHQVLFIDIQKSCDSKPVLYQTLCQTVSISFK